MATANDYQKLNANFFLSNTLTIKHIQSVWKIMGPKRDSLD